MDKLVIGAYVVATAAGLVLLKLSSNGSPFLSIVDGKVLWNVGILTIVGIAVYGLSFLLYIFLISKYNLGYIIPLTTGLVYILVFFASFTVFNESFTTLKVIAIALILSGVIMLNLNSSPKSSNVNKETAHVNTKSSS